MDLQTLLKGNSRTLTQVMAEVREDLVAYKEEEETTKTSLFAKFATKQVTLQQIVTTNLTEIMAKEIRIKDHMVMPT